MSENKSEYKKAGKEKPQHRFKLLNGHSMQFAFKLGDINYWEFTDTNNAPTLRMMTAFTFYEEFNMRCTRDFLLAHCEAFESQLSGANGKIDLIQAAKLCLNLRERLSWVFEPETAYKYASVVFVDDNEDPYNYDFKYNQEKIKLWKEQKASSFFLSMPVKKLFPQLTLSEPDLQTYLKEVRKMDKSHLEHLMSILSSDIQIRALSALYESHRQEELV